MGVRGRAGRWALRLVVAGVAVWAATVAAVLWFSAEALARHGDGRSLAAPVDAAVVLSGGADGDGVLGYSSRRRVATAVALFQAGKAEYLIMTGGPARWTEVSLAELMRDHALGLGVPADRVLVEKRATTTFENLRFAFAMADERGLGRLALVTDAFHLPRAGVLARYFGKPDISLVAAPGLSRDGAPNRLWSILREGLAWWYNLYKAAAWEGLAAIGWSPAERMAVVR